MIKKMVAISLMVGFAVATGRCEEPVKGRLYFFLDAGVIAQKVKDGVLLWSRDDVANKRTWRDANNLVFLKLKDTRGIKKGMEFGSAWMKYTGTYRHGNLLVGHRDISAFELPSKEEVEQAQYEEKRKQERELLKQKEEARQREIEHRKALEQRRFEEEQRRIKEQAEQEKIERELQRQREENDRRLAAERAKAEIEAERQRQEEARRAEKERKRRYPIEQKERAEYAKEMLSKMSFDVNSYFDIQRDLKRFIYSISVTEKKWSLLKELQAKGDWLGMLNAMSESEMKDFPAQAQIAAIIESLKKSAFHVEFLFTHKKYSRDAIRVGWVNLRRLSYAFVNPEHFNNVERFTEDSTIVTFSMSASEANKLILYAKGFYQPERKLFDKRNERLRKISSDVELGKIASSDAENRRNEVEEEFRREIATWIETSKVSDAVHVFGERVRERLGTNIDTGKSRIGNKSDTSSRGSKPKWATCPDCNGSRYIDKGRCDKCDGVGQYRTAITRGIGGRAMGGRMTQCDKCKGKGEISESCKTCYGRGKIKQ